MKVGIMQPYFFPYIGYFQLMNAVDEFVVYDNIVLTHVLEHLDNPVLVLKRINDEWLAEDGWFFMVCPNANVPLKTDIIAKEYLEGCYKLGQQYPDLCSSIFLMCERGK
jgi:hypothetical protein